MSNQLTVYIVDDDSMVRRSTGFLLGTAGFSVRPYLNGRDFLEDLADITPGCVLLDIRMPDIDGFQVLEALEPSLRNDLPVIVMTGHGDVATAVRAMRAGACDFLEKPFEESALRETLDRAFARIDVGAKDTRERQEAEALIEKLTPREIQVLQGLIRGLPNKVLAFELGLSVRTVEMHRAKMMERLGVRTLPSALRIAFRGGLAP